MSSADFAAEIDAAVCQYVELDSATVAMPETLLSPEERSRAARLRFGVDRDRYVAAHGALRLVLAEQCALHASAINLAYGPLGKPWLPDRAGLHFSLSHSGALALIAVGRRGPIGVDVEHLRPVPDALTLAERHFSPTENRALRSVPKGQRARAFLTCWTRKEASLKAIGLGLCLDLSKVEVGLEPTLRRVDIALGKHVLSVILGPAPERPDSVASLAVWCVSKPLREKPDVFAQAARALQAATTRCSKVDQRVPEVSP